MSGMNTNDKLPAEWEAIVGKAVEATFSRGYTSDISQFLRDAVERCYALVSKPPRELTDSMLATIGRKSGTANLRLLQLRSIIVEYERVMREPETVTFRAARRNDTGEVRMLPLNFGTIEGYWEWIEPPQTFEVKL